MSGRSAATGAGRQASPRHFGLAGHLLALLLAGLLPALLIGGLAAGTVLHSSRSAFEARLQNTTRALAVAIDQEIAAHVQALEALAARADLGPGGIQPSFDAAARSVAAALGTSISVYGPGPLWQQLLHTARPAGAPLPAGLAMGYDPRAPVPRVFITGRPAISDIARGSVLGRATAVAVVPVSREGRVVAAIAAVLDTGRFSRPLAAIGLSGGALATLIDGKGTVVARSEQAEEMQGRLAPAWYMAAIAERPNGLLTGQSMEGQPMVMAFQRLASDPAWTLVTAEPEAAYRRSWQEPLVLLVAGGGAALGSGLLAAALLVRRLLRPVRALLDHARTVAAGGSTAPPDVADGITEFARLRDYLADTRTVIVARDTEAAKLAAALDTTPFMVRHRDGTIRHWSRGMEDLYGWPANLAIGRSSHVLLATEFLEPLAAIEAALQRDGQWEGQLRHRTRDGQVLVVASRWWLHHAAPGAEPVVVEGSSDITARVEAERSRDLVARELQHRVKNLLATVQALAVQTLRTARDDPEQFAAAFMARLRAMGRVQDLLTAEDWRDAELAAVLRAALAPWLGSGGRIALVGGGRLRISARQAQALVLGLHELATNAGKHGALSVPEGHVILLWRAGQEGDVALDWTERGGPPVRVPPARRGLGSRLLDALPRELGPRATVTLRHEPEGVSAAIRFQARAE